jgi:hypothetical protein
MPSERWIRDNALVDAASDSSGKSGQAPTLASRSLRPIGLALAIAGVLSLTVAVTAQFEAPARPHDGRAVYDGRYTFVRLRWQSDRRRGFWNSAWDHDYPAAEQHLGQILRELTLVDARVTESRVLTLDDPELFRYPMAFMWEPGFWTLSDHEAESFRAYLQKGGFAVFEDFDGRGQWATFEQAMRRVLPGSTFVRLETAHPIFNSFFAIRDVYAITHPMVGLRPSYLGIYEDNDPSKRLMVIANFDNDVPEYWEWSGRGLFPFDTSNEAYKLGVNYTIYAHTH